jgi:hypothetical protein
MNVIGMSVFMVRKPERPMEPERRLMAAVLEDAIHCYRRESGRERRERSRLFREAAEWFASDDATWPFSCVNVCAALDIDLGCLRATLAREAEGSTHRATIPPRARLPRWAGERDQAVHA